MDPGVAFLLMRGLKTLEVRVRRQGETAMAVARFLSRHPKVSRVHYPGLPAHPDHRLAKRQMGGFGSMLAFDLRGGLPAARRFCDACESSCWLRAWAVWNPWWSCPFTPRITG